MLGPSFSLAYELAKYRKSLSFYRIFTISFALQMEGELCIQDKFKHHMHFAGTLVVNLNLDILS